MPDQPRVPAETTAARSAPASLSADQALQLTEFARVCRAAARAVSLYPAGHPTIETTLSRLAAATTRLTERGPFRLQITADRLLVDGAAAPRQEAAMTELAALLHRHLVGALTLNAGAGEESWRTLLLLLARSADDVRADGGLARLWATAGGPSVEIEEIDYAEVLREKQGLATAIEDILTAAMAGPKVRLDESGLRLLREIVGDPAKLDALVAELERTNAPRGGDAMAAVLMKLLREVTQYVSAMDPSQLPPLFQQLGHGARRLSASSMLALLSQRGKPEAMVNGTDVAAAVADGMGDESVAEFVAGSVVQDGTASERLAHAFSALVPDVDRQRQLLALARDRASATPLGAAEGFPELWQRVSGMLTSYTDATFVSDGYARELSLARTQPLDVEKTADDPPERIAGWLATVSDSALRALDRSLLTDLLAIEADALRWRDIADTVVAHADDLVRVGYFEQAWHLVESVCERAGEDPARQPHGAAALERFGQGAMLKHVATHLRSAADDEYDRFTRLCHRIGPSVVPPLAEAVAAEQDARSRRRLRDILVGFGSRGRESVQQLMNAQNWEVRRTAAYLLREFGGAEGLKELIPLLTDPEPLVQREAVQGLVFNGSAEASDILLHALTSAAGRTREVLVNELLSMRDDRAALVFCHLVRHLNRRALPHLYAAALDALGHATGREPVEALRFALAQGDWSTPLLNRRFRASAAQSLVRIGTPEALDALREAAARGSRGARAAARAELARTGA
jgi:HEAT repeat protein